MHACVGEAGQGGVVDKGRGQVHVSSGEGMQARWCGMDGDRCRREMVLR